MPKPEKPKSGPRLIARVDSETQKIIIKAAVLSGTMSQYVLSSTLEWAHEVNAREGRIKLSRESAERMMAILDNTPEPSPKFLGVAIRYREAVRGADHTDDQ